MKKHKEINLSLSNEDLAMLRSLGDVEKKRSKFTTHAEVKGHIEPLCTILNTDNIKMEFTSCRLGGIISEDMKTVYFLISDRGDKHLCIASALKIDDDVKGFIKFEIDFVHNHTIIVYHSYVTKRGDMIDVITPEVYRDCIKNKILTPLFNNDKKEIDITKNWLFDGITFKQIDVSQSERCYGGGGTFVHMISQIKYPYSRHNKTTPVEENK